MHYLKLFFRYFLFSVWGLFYWGDGIAQNTKTIVLTFDDAAQSHYSYVAPLLKRYGFGATFYVCEFPPDFSDSLKYMNWKQIQQLDKMGFEIGNHTWHHKHVEKLSEEDLRAELAYIESKCKSLGIARPVSFAYPGYTTGGLSVKVLKETGYSSARTGGDLPYKVNLDDPFLMPSFTPVDDLAKAITAIKQAKDGDVVVLTIHGIPDVAHPWVSTSPSVFEAYLKFLYDNGYRVISMRDLMNEVNSGKNKPAVSAPVFSASSWISPNDKENTGKRVCPVFKKDFVLSGKVKSASLSITALGLYEAKLNGNKIGSDYFTPGFTNYNKRLQYQVYDVTGLVKGSNELCVTVGEGWYRGVFRGPKPKNNYGAEAGLLLELSILYSDGKTEKIVSDGTWKCAAGPIYYSELYDGEFQDRGYVISGWSAVKVLNHTKAILAPSETAPVRAQEHFKPVRIFNTPAGDQVIDFGQNLAGWVKLNLKGKKGDTVRLYHAEVLDEKGNFYTGNLRNAKAMDTYILKGDGVETIEPHFTYHGFRYVKVEGFKATSGNVRAVALYSDLKRTGTFSCSNPKINQLQNNILWSMKSNFFDIPTDCPQRSERLGWTEDADVFCPTACYLMDVKDFYSKWLADLAAEQHASGCVPPTVPSMWGDNTMGIAGWSDAATFTPWTIYQRYGDTTILSRQYASMKAWVDYVRSMSPGYLWKANGFGDWYPAGPETDIGYLDQCYWYRSTWIVLETAKLLGHSADVQKYTALLAEIKKAFEQTYLQHIPHTQTAYVVGIAFGLLPKDHIAKLAQLVKENNNHLATGFMGTPYLLGVLSENGYAELAYQLLLQEGIPSWLYMVNHGATTMWEKWDAVKPDGKIQQMSLNHYAFGSIGNWLYENIAGIRPASAGYQKILIQPVVGGGLTWAKGSYRSAFGDIVSQWKLSGKRIKMKVEIPRGTTAQVFVPGTGLRSVGPGKYSFEGRI